MTVRETAGKRPYEKPRLLIIELTAEEIMGKCKFSSGGTLTGPTGPCGGCAQATTS